MKRRVPQLPIKKQMLSSDAYRRKLKTFALPILPQKRAKKLEVLLERTTPIRSSKRRTHPLFSPHSKTVLVRRRTKTMGPSRGNLRRDTLLGRAHRTPGHRNPCTQRDIRKSVLFFKKLIGFSGSSPGRLRTYKRTVDSNFSCK